MPATLATLQAILAALPAQAKFGLRDEFAEEQYAPFQGFTAYAEETTVCLYLLADEGPDAVRVEVYDNDGNGDTFFHQDLTGLPVGVAAAWVAEALAVTPPAGYYARIAQANLDRALAARERAYQAFAQAQQAVRDAEAALAAAPGAGTPCGICGDPRCPGHQVRCQG